MVLSLLVRGWTTRGSPAPRSGRESIAATTSVPTFISNSIFRVSILFQDIIFHTTARSVETRRSTWPPRPSERPFRRASFHLCANPFVFVRFFFLRVLPPRSTHLDVQLRGSRDACGTRHAREGDLHSCVVETCFGTGSGAIPIPTVVFRVSPIKRFPIERKTNPGLCRVHEPDPRPSRTVHPSHPHQRIFSWGGGDECEPWEDRRERRVHSLLEVEVLHVVVPPPSPWSAPEMCETGSA